MKKSIVFTIVVVLVGVISVGAYAHGGYAGSMLRWVPGFGSMMGRWGTHGGHGSMMSGWGTHGGQSGWNTPAQPGTVPQVIAEDTVKEIAATYIAQYLPGYTIEKIEKDEWRPMYFVTLKGENNAELQMWIHGFGGQVMHIVPKTAE